MASLMHLEKHYLVLWAVLVRPVFVGDPRLGMPVNTHNPQRQSQAQSTANAQRISARSYKSDSTLYSPKVYNADPSPLSFSSLMPGWFAR